MSHLDELDWDGLAEQLDTQGVAILPGLLLPAACRQLADLGSGIPTRNGRAGLKALADIERLRHALYTRLQPTANRWAQAIGSAQRYPPRLQDFLRACHQTGQWQPQSALHWLAAGAHLASRQQTDATLAFPLQACILLSTPGVDFTGGELVLTEQRPRMQTRAMVPPLQQGDAALFATRHRPHRGARGFYRTTLTQAVSVVRSGARVAVDLQFHPNR